MSRLFQIAIDGPVGAGKSEVSRRLAAKLGILYLYTGVMYRAVAFECLEKQVDPHDELAVTVLASQLNIRLLPSRIDARYPVKVELSGVDVTERLFTEVVERLTPQIAAVEGVRKEMVRQQQAIAHGQSVVAEGRDIGLRVFPYAQLKVYLTASLAERSQRRHAMALKKGAIATLEQVMEDTRKRDEVDMNRAVDPLQKLPDAWELDTTGMTQEQVIEALLHEVKQRGLT